MRRKMQEEYNRVVGLSVLRVGRLVSQNPSFYGWSDYNPKIPAHMRSCDVILGAITESYWQQFEGTFFEGDTSHYGIDVAASCSCGVVKDRIWRFEGTFSDVLGEILTQKRILEILAQELDKPENSE